LFNFIVKPDNKFLACLLCWASLLGYISRRTYNLGRNKLKNQLAAYSLLKGCVTTVSKHAAGAKWEANMLAVQLLD